MILSITDTISRWINDATDFVDKNWSSPWFWIAAFIALFVLGLLIISKFADN